MWVPHFFSDPRSTHHNDRTCYQYFPVERPSVCQSSMSRLMRERRMWDSSSQISEILSRILMAQSVTWYFWKICKQGFGKNKFKWLTSITARGNNLFVLWGRTADGSLFISSTSSVSRVSRILVRIWNRISAAKISWWWEKLSHRRPIRSALGKQRQSTHLLGSFIKYDL